MGITTIGSFSAAIRSRWLRDHVPARMRFIATLKRSTVSAVWGPKRSPRTAAPQDDDVHRAGPPDGVHRVRPDAPGADRLTCGRPAALDHCDDDARRVVQPGVPASSPKSSPSQRPSCARRSCRRGGHHRLTRGAETGGDGQRRGHAGRTAACRHLGLAWSCDLRRRPAAALLHIAPIRRIMLVCPNEIAIEKHRRRLDGVERPPHR